jgi:two-component system cell cycle sensor histidine kinase/response regulator CckA
VAAIPSNAEALCWALLEHSPFGALLLSREGRFLGVNRAYCRMLGKTTEELLGRQVFSVVSPERSELNRARWAELLSRPGGTITLELARTDPAGQTQWLEYEAINLLDDPSVGGVLGFCRNVTARKQAELAARESEARLNFLISATDAVTYTLRAEGDFGATFVGERVLEMTGYSASEFIGDPALWLNNVHPDDRARILIANPTLFERGHHTYEYRFRHKDGNYRWMHDSIRVVRDERGKPVELIGFWTDVTLQKETQLALEQSEMTFRTLVENLPIAALINRGMQILYANPAMLKMLGYSSLDEFRSQDLMSFVHPDDREMILKRIDRLNAGQNSPPAERRAIRKDGKVLTLEGEGFALPIDGQMAYVVLFRDLTERKELLARMAVADRMVSVGMLAAGVAHELNTPLAYVGANLGLIAESLPQLVQQKTARVPAEQLGALLEDCKDGIERVVSVVRDLRTLSQVQEGTLTRVDVRAAIQSALKMTHNELRHRARLEERYDEELFVIASEGRLVQLFINLLMNAVQAIPEGAVERNQVGIAAFRRESEVVIEISDTGEGIGPDALSRVFDPFFTTKIGSGTGLGLPICQGIVRTFGGELSLRSELQRGTTAVVTLPFAAEARPPREEQTPPAGKRPARVLVIDDEVRYGATLKLLLAPHEVVSLADPREALSRIGAAEHFDVIFCDLMIPAMNGMDFYSELLRLDPASTRRLVFLTGGAFTHRAREFLGSVQNLCLEKPATERTLRETIDQIVASEAPHEQRWLR